MLHAERLAKSVKAIALEIGEEYFRLLDLQHHFDPTIPMLLTLLLAMLKLVVYETERIVFTMIF